MLRTDNWLVIGGKSIRRKYIESYVFEKPGGTYRPRAVVTTLNNTYTFYGLEAAEVAADAGYVAGAIEPETSDNWSTIFKEDERTYRTTQPLSKGGRLSPAKMAEQHQQLDAIISERYNASSKC